MEYIIDIPFILQPAGLIQALSDWFDPMAQSRPLEIYYRGQGRSVVQAQNSKLLHFVYLFRSEA